MAVKRKRIPRYSKVQVNGYEYYKTDIEDADGKRVILYGKTREEVYDKEMAAIEESHVIDTNPTIYLEAKGGGVPQEERQALTDEQVERLLDAIRGFPPYVFVMIGLYAGLRRAEILALQWDSVYLDTEAPYLMVRRAWHTEHTRPIILTELKTKDAERNIPLPDRLAECLKEAKKKSKSDYVIANQDGEPLQHKIRRARLTQARLICNGSFF